MAIEHNNPLRLKDADGKLRAFESPQLGLVAHMAIRRRAGVPKDEAIAQLKARVRDANGEPPPGTANGDWLDDVVYESAWSLSKPLAQSRTIRGSVLSGLSGLSAAVLQVSQDILPHAVAASQSVEAVWPQAVRWVLIAICVAGAWMSYSARRGAREEGAR